MKPTWDKAFSKDTVEHINTLAPKVYREIERHANVKVTTWPAKVETMTKAEINEGSDTGAGHGLYYPDEKRLKLNPKMPKWQVLANFVHENCHHACPDLAEHEIRELAMDVVHAVKSKKSRRNPIKGMPGGSVKACIKQMERRGDIDDPGAYCAAIADRIEPGWRSRNPYDPSSLNKDQLKAEIAKWRKMKLAAEDAMDRAPPHIRDLLADEDIDDIPEPWDRVARLYDTSTTMIRRLEAQQRSTRMLHLRLLR